MRHTLFVLGLALSLGGSAFAEEAAPAAPCHVIATSCKAAGYARHAKDKNLRRDCMKPILSGQSVEGVTVQPADVQACQARIQARRNKS
jgi:hypothetical protein